MIVIPAIDLKEGKCVRLEQGLMEKDTVFCDNPSEQALEWQRQGGELLHIVDLDGAFAGKPANRSAIEAIVGAVSIPTQLGGGIRDIQTIEAYLSLGVGRVILGTAAQRNPALVEEACRLFPYRIVVGIDAKNGMVAVQGWAEVTDMRAVDLARRLEGHGVTAIIYTDISRDGMMQGVNVEATAQLAREARFVDMFHREGKLALLLQNRCIVETLELGQHEHDGLVDVLHANRCVHGGHLPRHSTPRQRRRDGAGSRRGVHVCGEYPLGDGKRGRPHGGDCADRTGGARTDARDDRGKVWLDERLRARRDRLLANRENHPGFDPEPVPSPLYRDRRRAFRYWTIHQLGVLTPARHRLAARSGKSGAADRRAL